MYYDCMDCIVLPDVWTFLGYLLLFTYFGFMLGWTARKVRKQKKTDKGAEVK